LTFDNSLTANVAHRYQDQWWAIIMLGQPIR